MDGKRISYFFYIIIETVKRSWVKKVPNNNQN